MIYLRSSFEIAIIATSHVINRAILMAMTAYTRSSEGRVGVNSQRYMAVTGECDKSRRLVFDVTPGSDAGAAAVLKLKVADQSLGAGSIAITRQK